MIKDDNYMDPSCDAEPSINDDDVDNKSEELVIMTRNHSCNISDTFSEKTFSSLDNDFEAILYDHSVIINCLKSTSYQRSQLEIGVLSQLLQSIPDFMYIGGTELEYICQAATLRIVENANEIIIKKCSTIKEWYYCLEGELRREDCDTTLLGPGSFIGIDLWSEDIMISDYDLLSNCDDCKLLVVDSQELKSMNKLNHVRIKTSDDDKSVIAVYELCANVSTDVNMCSYVLTKGTHDVLLSHLFSNQKSVSEDYVEDFFLTQDLFLNSTRSIRNDIANSIYSENEYAKDKFDILIRWISQNFTIFERDLNILLFIDKIINILKNKKNNHWLYILCECCSNVAKVREINEVLSFNECIIPVTLENQTLYYIHQINDLNLGLHNGDVIMELDGNSREAVTWDMIKSLSDENRAVSISIRNDMLGYHEHVLKDISMDNVSIHSTPSNSQYSHCFSDKMSDAISISTTDSDNNISLNLDKTSSLQKRPSMIPAFFSNFQSGTVGRFFKNPKHYTKGTLPSSSRSNSDVTTRLDILQNGRDLVGSNFSISRLSRRIKSKRQRRSVGSNPDLIKSFDDLEVGENTACKWPIRIYLKDAFINYMNHNITKTDLRFFHIMIQSNTTVTEVIIRTLLKLSLSSAKSYEFYLVEVKVNEASGGMIHEKILHPNTSNLIDRLREHCRFYMKHRSFVGESLILQSEADKMKEEFKLPTLLQMPVECLVVRLFLRSYKLFCKILPQDLINHVTKNKNTLKFTKDSVKMESIIFQYMHLSDFYKYWVMTEICSESNITSRALVIQFFIQLAFKAIYIGHIDLFFSLISGIESVEVSKLSLTWDKVSKRDKKLLKNLKKTLDVSSNMRNLRIIHQKMKSPFIPVTAMTIKDLTMLEETQPTYCTGTINDIQVNKNLVNFNKMRKMAQLARNFVNSGCACIEEKTRPVRKHLSNCKMKMENYDSLDRILQHRLENQPENNFYKLSPVILSDKFNRKHSFSNVSMHSSSTESLPESAKLNEEKSNCQAYEHLIMVMKIERYLTTLDEKVIIDPVRLSELFMTCEQNNVIDGGNETKLKYYTKSQKISQDVTTDLSNDPNIGDISDKAAEILGLREKSKIHRFKKGLVLCTLLILTKFL